MAGMNDEKSSARAYLTQDAANRNVNDVSDNVPTVVVNELCALLTTKSTAVLRDSHSVMCETLQAKRNRNGKMEIIQGMSERFKDADQERNEEKCSKP